MDDRPPSGGRPPDGPADDGARFTCASCGRVAAVVRLAPAGTPVDLGHPVGTQVLGRDGVVVDHWLGSGWQQVDPATWARISDLLAAAQPDPGELHAIDWGLAPFWCRTCRQCYCHDHWLAIVIMDEGFYDYTEGLCPAGHRQMLDD